MDLEKYFSTQYFSKYSLVIFNENIGYYEAMKKGRAQYKALLSLIADPVVYTHLNMTKEELKVILVKIKQDTNTILEEDKIVGLLKSIPTFLKRTD